eukprot:6855863-Pyramimonas_sp.AAC.1
MYAHDRRSVGFADAPPGPVSRNTAVRFGLRGHIARRRGDGVRPMLREVGKPDVVGTENTSP